MGGQGYYEEAGGLEGGGEKVERREGWVPDVDGELRDGRQDGGKRRGECGEVE